MASVKSQIAHGTAVRCLFQVAQQYRNDKETGPVYLQRTRQGDLARDLALADEGANKCGRA
jgi:hypothetical protein